jgi:hypothetical protein
MVPLHSRDQLTRMFDRQALEVSNLRQTIVWTA